MGASESQQFNTEDDRIQSHLKGEDRSKENYHVNSDFGRRENKNSVTEKKHLHNSSSNYELVGVTQTNSSSKYCDSQTNKNIDINSCEDQNSIKNCKNDTDSGYNKQSNERFGIDNVSCTRQEKNSTTVLANLSSSDNSKRSSYRVFNSNNKLNTKNKNSDNNKANDEFTGGSVKSSETIDKYKEKDHKMFNSESSEDEETYRFPINLQGEQKHSYRNNQTYKLQISNSNGNNQEKENKKILGLELRNYQHDKRQTGDRYGSRNNKDEKKNEKGMEHFRNYELNKNQTVHLYEDKERKTEKQPNDEVRNYDKEERQMSKCYSSLRMRYESNENLKSHQHDMIQSGNYCINQFQGRRNEKQHNEEVRSYQQDRQSSNCYNNEGRRNERSEDFRSQQHEREQSGNYSGNKFQGRRNERQHSEEFRSYQQDRRQSSNCYNNEGRRNERQHSEEFRSYQQDRRQSGNCYNNEGRKNERREDFRSQQHEREQSGNFSGNQFQGRRNERQHSEEFRSYQQDRRQSGNCYNNEGRKNERSEDFKSQQHEREQSGNYSGNQFQGRRNERQHSEEFRSYLQDRREGENSQKKSNGTSCEHLVDFRDCEHDSRQICGVYGKQNNENKDLINERQFGYDIHCGNNQNQKRNENQLGEKFTNYQHNKSETRNWRGNQNYQNRGRRYVRGKQFNSYNKQEGNDHCSVQKQQQSFKSDKYIKDKEENFSDSESSRPSSVQSSYENQERNCTYKSHNFEERPNSSQSDYLVGQSSNDNSGHSMNSSEGFDFRRGNYKRFGNRQKFKRGLHHSYNRPNRENFSQRDLQFSTSQEPTTVKQEEKNKHLNRRDGIDEIYSRGKTAKDEEIEENSELDTNSETGKREESSIEVGKPVQVLSVDFKNNFPLEEEEANRRNIDLNEEVKDLLLFGKEGDVVVTEQPNTLRDIMVFMQKYPNATAVTLKD